jgi:putative ABC transport system ATP-binding protein
MSKELIIAKNLKKDYNSTRALKGVDLVVIEGEWLSIVGPSGSGKTTLLNLLGGLDRPTSGSIKIDGVDLCSMTENELAHFRREKIGFIFQQHHLVPYLTALENVMLAQYFHSLPDEEEAREALKRVGLEHRLAHRPSELSGGEQQRVCVARALINKPSLLLADEPTGNLDLENALIVLDILHQLHQEEEFTIILVTHNPMVANKGERILTIEDGRITQDVTKEASKQTSIIKDSGKRD